MASQPRSQPRSEPVAELKFGQVGIANLKLKQLDVAALRAELAEKVTSAPQLFQRAPVVLDLSHLATLPDAATVQQLLDAVRAAGMLPVGLAYGTTANEALAVSLNLPIFAKFRAAYEKADGEPAAERPAPRAVEPAPAPAPAAPAARGGAGLHHAQPVRSGQQVYARGRDLVVTATVGNGAEVIADGSIHVYGTLRGKALAGAQGDAQARIFCQDFQAELVSIAGQYRVFEDIPADLRGKPVQAWLEGDKLLLARLG